VPALNFNVTAMDRASQAFNRIADRIDMLVARMAALNASSANVRVDVDTDPADRTLGRWTVTFRQRLRQAMSDIPVDLDLHAGATNAERELARSARKSASTSTVTPLSRRSSDSRLNCKTLTFSTPTSKSAPTPPPRSPTSKRCSLNFAGWTARKPKSRSRSTIGRSRTS
jgi:hypothetical protein